MRSLVLAVLFVTSLARADDFEIVPPDHVFHGMTYAQWQAEWWKWAYGQPVDANPVLDTTGEFADVDQSGAVWFLAGSFGETITRTVTIPSGKFLFFPIVNAAWIGPPTLKIGRYHNASFIDSVGDIACEIDGVSVSDLDDYRSATAYGDQYGITLPDNNFFGIPATTLYRTVDDGIYLMLRPLDPGEHTIHIYASDDVSFTVDVTYDLTVE